MNYSIVLVIVFSSFQMSRPSWTTNDYVSLSDQSTESIEHELVSIVLRS